MKKDWNPTVTNIMKDGTTYTSDEWSEYWETHTLPLNEDTEPFYRALISIAEEKIKEKAQKDNKKTARALSGNENLKIKR